MTVDLFADPGPFTVTELAEICRCSPRYLHKAIEAGALRARKLGRNYRIPASVARQFALELGVEPPELPGAVRNVREVRSMREMRMDNAALGAHLETVESVKQ